MLEMTPITMPPNRYVDTDKKSNNVKRAIDDIIEARWISKEK